MTCKKIFWDDPYLTHLDTHISSVTGNVLTFRETIFFACSGGQDSDAGTVNGLPILRAEKAGKEIRYTVPEGHGLTEGAPARLAIDWERRYRLMRLHFAAELVLELVCQNYNHPEKVGANISEDRARVDFLWEGNITAIFPELQRRLQELVAADLPITSCFSDAGNEIRYWEVAGFARVPCGGTHLRRTGEIGPVRLRRRNPGSGRERIEIELDRTDEAAAGAQSPMSAT